MTLSTLSSAWRGTFALYAADDAESAWCRAHQLSAVVRLTPYLMAANVFSALVVAAIVFRESPRLLSAWASVLAVVIAAAMRAYRISRDRVPESVSRRAFRSATRHAAVMGALWGAVPIVWLADVGPQSQVVIATLTAGMLSAGAFVLSPVPAASLAYVGIIVAGLARRPLADR